MSPSFRRSPCLLAFLIDKVACAVPDVMQNDRILFDGKEEAVRSRFFPINHLPEGDPKSLRFLFGDGMPFGKFAQLGYGFL